ncbi:hypothetical protein H2248_006266 [Termitomyces sp. 'cryptogamus']|nr:hypothetical protein H2248_006266 [Termitomyces sp. 'cryptogamus']
MNALPSPISDTSGNISLHISSIPKINKTQFISSYLQEQTIYAKTHAAEGRAFERSWKHEKVPEAPTSNLEETPEPQKASKLATDYGFGTPVLKPRVTQRCEDNQETSPMEDIKISNIGKDVTHGDDAPETEIPKQKTKLKRPRSSVPRNNTSMHQSRQKLAKDISICGSEKEQEQRLKERRDRKRAKRVVMQAASNDGSPDEPSAEELKEKEKKKMTKKIAEDKGLALMHGFTATNVGTGRLTVKPFLNVGVFNKGKASVKSRPIWRNKASGKKAGKMGHSAFDIQPLTMITLLGHLGGGFIEHDFLSKTCMNSRERGLASGSSSSSMDSETSSNSGTRIKKRSRQTAQRLQKTKNSASRLRSSPSIAENIRETIKRGDKKRPASIIWNIERESAILPSHLSTLISDKPISVLLDTKNTSWSKVPVDLAHHDTPLFNCLGPTDLHLTVPSGDTELGNKCHNSPSIGPSESASQRGNLSVTCHDLPAMEASSRYFGSVPQPQLFSKEGPPSKIVSNEIKIRKVASIESLASCEFEPTDEKRDFPVMLSSDDIVTPDEKRCAILCDLDNLPFVEPQDYKYSDCSLRLGPHEDLVCYDGMFQAVTPSYSALDGLDDEQLRSKNFFSRRWDELEGAHPQDLHFEPTEDEGQYPTQDESLEDSEDQYDDRYDSPENETRSNPSSGIANEIWNRSSIYNADTLIWNSEELAYQPGNFWQDTVQVNNADNLSISRDLDMRSGSESCGSVDLIGTFTEGKALLHGYSEAEVRAFYSESSMPCHQTQITAAEADVAKKLKNHWLPQRL